MQVLGLKPCEQEKMWGDYVVTLCGEKLEALTEKVGGQVGSERSLGTGLGRRATPENVV